VEEQENLIDVDAMQMLLPTRSAMRILRQFHRNTHPLLTQKILEPAGGVLARENEWSLSHRAAKELLGDLCPEMDEVAKKGIICANSIGTKSLFYPNKTARQISELENLLMPEKFDRVQESLVAHGMRKGFACLFYGAPGTGKTETVLQLARKTGRAIMQVDMSEMRDKFVGESEKNVKAVFTRYRRLCSESDLTPILLLNEADALLSVRLTSVEHSVDQMENTMQNIILQEMENLDGILIATTNLTQNLDAAFDRRFLYKVEFKKPTAEESRHIWQAMLPALDEENARSLASKYDFSGGQIENIARKQVVSNILHDSDALDMSLIREACDAERLNRQNGERIRITGFC
jgi:SpoVK/Ycf46/Vps4 family AAA+-type ATPase